jgi:hypothetical protein
MTVMTPEEIEKELPATDEIDGCEYRDSEREDDCFLAFLYRNQSGRAFRYVWMSGMDSHFDGTGNIGQCLTQAEEQNWKEF